VKVSILAFDDFTDLDLILHWDILNRVRYVCGIEDWDVRIVGTKPSHISALGLAIPTSVSIETLRDSNGIILCSGKGTRALLNDESYLIRLGLNPKTQFIGAQCSGSLILGALGFLRDVEVSAYPPIIESLREYGAKLVDRSLVVHDNLATASSCLAGQFLSEWMIRVLVGSKISKRVMDTVMPLDGMTDLKLNSAAQ
jgi:putative intracellular protease/amidase